MKSMMIGAATATALGLALLAGPVLAASGGSSGSIADSPAATSAGVSDATRNPPCVPGSNDAACGGATSGSSGNSDAMGSGASRSTTGGGTLDNGPAPGVDRKKAPGLSDTPTSTSGSSSGR